jgi:hypothetical protein
MVEHSLERRQRLVLSRAVVLGVGVNEPDSERALPIASYDVAIRVAQA